MTPPRLSGKTVTMTLAPAAKLPLTRISPVFLTFPNDSTLTETRPRPSTLNGTNSPEIPALIKTSSVGDSRRLNFLSVDFLIFASLPRGYKNIDSIENQAFLLAKRHFSISAWCPERRILGTAYFLFLIFNTSGLV